MVEDVPTLSARIEEKQKRIEKRPSNVVLSCCAQFLNFFYFSSPKGDVVEDVPTLSARIEEKQKRIENRKGLRAYKLKN